jgi:hypothetical protein
MCLVVDLQAFAPWIFFGEASCKEMLRGPTVEFQREFATLIPTSNPPWRWLLKAHQNSVGCDAKMDQPAPLGCRQ